MSGRNLVISNLQEKIDNFFQCNLCYEFPRNMWPHSDLFTVWAEYWLFLISTRFAWIIRLALFAQLDQWPGQMKTLPWTSTLCKPRTTSAQIQLQASACSSSKGFLKTTPLWQQYTSIKLSLFKWNVSALFLWRHLIKAHSMLTHSLPSRVQKLQTGGADNSGMAVNIFAPIFLFKFAAIPFVCRVSLELCTTMQLPT